MVKRSPLTQIKPEVKRNDVVASAWWGKSGTPLSEIDLEQEVSVRKTRDVAMSKLGGAMVLFRAPMSIKIHESTTVSPIDTATGKVCIQISEEQFEFFTQLHELMTNKHIVPKIYQKGWNDAEIKPFAVRSASSDKPYVKVKVQTHGFSRTTGINSDGVEVLDTFSLLENVGSVGDFMLKVEGVYATSQYAGLLVKIDMFVMKSAPSDEEVQSRKRARIEDAETLRNKLLVDFVGRDVQRVETD